MNYLYIFGTIFFTVYGQLILKWRIGIYGTLPDILGDCLLFLIIKVIDLCFIMAMDMVKQDLG